MKTRQNMCAAVAVAILAFTVPAVAAPSVEAIARNCVVCHGPKEAGQAEIPTLANYPAKKMVEMLSGFKADQKPATIMNRITKAFSDEQIAALADLLGTK